MQLNIFQSVNGKAAVILHVIVIRDSSRATITMFHTEKPCCNNLDNHFDVIIDNTPKDIIQEGKNEAWGSDVSSQPEVCRDDDTQLGIPQQG